MSELAALRRLRATNSKLMRGNLALLMSIRETDSEIEEEWRELQRCCELLEQDGRAIPPSCLALMGTADGGSPRPDQENSANDKLSTNEPDDAAPSNGEKHAGGPAASALSVRNVLNAEPSDEEEEEEEEASHDSGESASNDGSADEP